MTPTEMYNQLNSLIHDYRQLQPLKPEDETRLWKKLRLDWNYNSNHMEGNTLTYTQTELLLIFDRVSGENTGREIEEMKSHDVAIKMVRELAMDKERELTEFFIRELNQIILVRPYWKEAITSDGQPTRREIIPGEYKKFPNSVRLENGEIFNYALPEETPALMGELMTFYQTNARSTEVHPVWLASMMHYKFVRIHPFDDGNGRLARLIMNYILMKNDYPPCIIKDEDKRNYLVALNKADTGDMESFVAYIGDKTKWSIELAIKAGKGEQIEEENDLDKEIAIFKQTRKNSESQVIPRSDNRTYQLYKSSFRILFENFEKEMLEKFSDMFASIVSTGFHNHAGNTEGLSLLDKRFDEWKYQIEDPIETKPTKFRDEFEEVSLHIDFKGFRNDRLNTFYLPAALTIVLDAFTYRILFKQSLLGEFHYTHTISKQEQDKIVKDCIRIFFEEIKSKIAN